MISADCAGTVTSGPYNEPNPLSSITPSLHTTVYLPSGIASLISIRKAHPAFRMGDAEMVRKHLEFLPVDERNTLRSQHCRLRQFVKSYELFGCDAGDTRLQAIYQAHIIVARYVTDHLSRLGSTGSFTVIHRIIVDLG